MSLLNGGFDASANWAVDRLSTGIAAGTTSMSLNDASEFPDPSVSGEYNVVLWDSTQFSNAHADPNHEIVRVTTKSGSTLTIERGQEDTSDVDHNTTGRIYAVALSFTQKGYGDFVNAFIDRPYVLLGYTDSIDFTSTGGKAVYSVSSTESVEVHKMVVLLDNVSGGSGTMNAGLGTNGTHDNIIPARDLVGFGAIGDVYHIDVEGKSVIATSSSTISLGVDSAFSGTVEGSVYLYGKRYY